MNATRALRLMPLLLLLAIAGSDAAAARDARTPREMRILYSSDWSGTYQIYAVAPNTRRPPGQVTFGRPAACLPANPCGYVDPVASPDGRYVLYWDYDLQGPQRRSLFVASSDGRNPRRLATVAGFQVEASWSPDSRRLAYGSDAAGAWVVGVDGSGRRRLSTSSARELAWSPSGDRIAFGSEDLFVVRPDGRALRRISDESVADVAWSPDGRLLAFAYNDVRVLAIATGRTRTIAAQSAYSVAWSPDGSLLAYSSDSAGVVTVDIPSGARHYLGSRIRQSELAWSPDGRRLVFVAPTRGFYREDELRVIDRRGAVRFTVSPHEARGGAFAGATWTRPLAGTRYRPPERRSLATGITDDALTARWPVQRLATNRGKVAFVACGHAFVWEPATRVLEQVEPQASLSPRCNTSTFYAGIDAYSLAIADDRVAFGLIGGGNVKYWWLGGQGTFFGARWHLPIAEGQASAAGPRQDFASNLVGQGSLLVFSSADVLGVNRETGVVTSEEILRVEDHGCPCQTIAAEPGPFVPYDVDAGRIAAAGDNAVVLLDARGTRLLNVWVKARSAQLSGPDLVVAAEGDLRRYDAATGALLRSSPLPNGASLQDTRRGLAAYVIGGQVHLARLSDGATAVVAPGTLARFFDGGLVYADGAQLRLVRFDELPLR